MKAINCPICGKLTYPDYCSDECLYRHYEQERIIELLEHMPRTDNDRTVDAPILIALIKGEK